jgi:hypothetical protein
LAAETEEGATLSTSIMVLVLSLALLLGEIIVLLVGLHDLKIQKEEEKKLDERLKRLRGNDYGW